MVSFEKVNWIIRVAKTQSFRYYNPAVPEKILEGQMAIHDHTPVIWVEKL